MSELKLRGKSANGASLIPNGPSGLPTRVHTFWERDAGDGAAVSIAQSRKRRGALLACFADLITAQETATAVTVIQMSATTITATQIDREP